MNLYVYCGNNPVMYSDGSGHSAKPVWWNPFTWNWSRIGEGAGLIVTGVAAIGVGLATLPYGGWIAAVAGITILAGGGTVAFGLSDIGEGITNYNLVQETIFNGNENAYNITENIFEAVAIVGSIVCGVYGLTHTDINFRRSTPRTSTPHSASYNTNSNVLTYYGGNGEMKYSVGFFEKDHQWIHWHTELPHSEPINKILKFIWEMIKKGF